MRIILPVISFGRSGGFRVLSQLANYWIVNGHEVFFLCPFEDGLISKPYYPTNAKIIYVNKNGEEIKQIEGGVVLGYDEEKSFYKRYVQLNSLRKALNKFASPADVILATYSLTSFSVYFSHSSKKKYYYIQAYEPEYFGKNLKGQISSIIVSLSYKLNLKRIVNSPIYFNYKNLNAKENVYPGLDFNVFNTKGKIYKSRFGEDPIRIGCIGRLEVSKGTKYVLEAFKYLKKKGIDCELHLAVFGNEDMLVGYNGVNTVTPQNDIELSLYYKSIDVLIAPGLLQHGAVHYPVIESMACGTPVITTGYYPANCDNSWLVMPHSYTAIANQIEKIILNPETAIKKAKKAVNDVKHLEWSIIANQMISIFKQQ